MKITAQELIDELKKLPPYAELEFIGRRKASRYQDPEAMHLQFDRLVFSAKPAIELVE